MKTLTFVTGNEHKIQDAMKLLPEFHIHGVDFKAPEIQSLDPKEIIEAKLQYSVERTQEPCFVMDASLFFDCLDGFPGPFIKYWWEESVGGEKTCQIAELLGERGCQFVSTLGYSDGEELHFFVETVKGTIADRPRGENGFHWDVIFIPEGETLTFAEMSFEEKQAYAPQNKLLTKLHDYLTK